MTPARERLLLVGLAGVLVLPLAVGLVALREPTWFPVLDLAMTEYRVRDVFSSHPPLIGLPGRIGRTLAEQGSHPGPLSFYLVAPVHRLLGSTAWAMQVATVVIHAGAVVTALLIARRRGGSRVAGAVAVALALLLRGYGVTLLTQPWNPYLPVLWWVVLLLAVWSVLDGDLPMLPVAVFAASLCAQTHVPYLALSLGLGAVAVVGAVPALRRDRSSWRWAAGAAVLGLVLWAPPIVEQVRHGDDGNLARLLAHFGDPPQESAGLGTGVELVLQHLDLTDLVADDDGALEVATAGTTGPAATGVVVLMAWLGAVGLAWRTRHRALMRLHAVVAAGLLLGVLSISRIFGNLWWYLMLWAWGVALLAASATVWSLRVAVGRRLPDVPPAGLAGLAVVLSAWFAVEAVDAEPPAARLSAGLGAILPATVDALESGVGGATGRDGNYVVAWRDAAHIGSQAYGLVSELERRGYRAGMTRGLRVPLTDARVIDPANATIELHFATGVNIDRFRRDAPSATEVVALDPRTPAERREFESLRRRAARDLRAAGLHDVVGHLEGNLFAASIDPRVGSPTRERIARLVELGLPLAVFVAPAGTSL
ncbi:MAG TPA: hypothetical protein VM933_10960 [Acidimicrobiales bacterium]|nr:hypothetical protein [Acidimicrobiales bacterium]